MIQHMRNEEKTTEFLLRQGALSDAQLQDLCKGLHQSVFGCGHFVTDAAAEVLRRELDGLPGTEGPEVEPLDGGFCRVHLRVLQKTALAPDTLLRLWYLTDWEQRQELTPIRCLSWRLWPRNLAFRYLGVRRFAHVAVRRPNCRNVRHFALRLENNEAGCDMSLVSAEINYTRHSRER